MSHKSRSTVKSVIYTLLAFIMSVLMFLLSFAITLQATILNPDFLLDNMNSTNYFVEKHQEVVQKLTDLGNASGLDESFFDDLLSSVEIYDDTEIYFEEYYSGKSTVVDTTKFRQNFNSALDKYIEKNNIQDVDSDSREYLVKNASRIYVSSVEVPFFSNASTYILALKKVMPFVIAGLCVMIAAIVLVIVFTNSWKHRALKYLCYATSGATLTVGIIPTLVFISGKIQQINISSRALYTVFVQSANSVMISLSIVAAAFLIISLTLFFVHMNMRKKLIDD